MLCLTADGLQEVQMSKVCVFVAMACLLLLEPASANEPLAHEVKVVPYSKNGEPTGCSIEYRMAFIDEVTTTPPSPLFVIGTLGWMNGRNNKPVGILKIKAAVPQGPTSAPVKVGGGSVRVGSTFYRVDTTVECDEPGSFCGAFGMDKAMDLMAAVHDGSTFINVLRAGSGRDLPVRMPLNIEQSAQLGSCLQLWLKKLAR